jgi:hypothetical protein
VVEETVVCSLICHLSLDRERDRDCVVEALRVRSSWLKNENALNAGMKKEFEPEVGKTK